MGRYGTGLYVGKCIVYTIDDSEASPGGNEPVEKLLTDKRKRTECFENCLHVYKVIILILGGNYKSLRLLFTGFTIEEQSRE